jgi:hypothetical protein
MFIGGFVIVPCEFSEVRDSETSRIWYGVKVFGGKVFGIPSHAPLV